MNRLIDGLMVAVRAACSAAAVVAACVMLFASVSVVLDGGYVAAIFIAGSGSLLWHSSIRLRAVVFTGNREKVES